MSVYDFNDFSDKKPKIRTRKLNLYYGNTHVLGDIDIDILECTITAIIGPSGCGKTSLLRQFNRMNDMVPSARTIGDVFIGETSIFDKGVYADDIRKRVGMVFQKPNVFPLSIYDNVAMGPRYHGIKKKSALNEIVERSLRRVHMWDEVKDILSESAHEISLGEQQRLCIARTIAVEPEVMLFDESCSTLDPESTLKIEELMRELAEQYTIVIVTHSMEQARRVSDMAAFLMIDDEQVGRIVEYAPTLDIFSMPKDKRTEAYITGRFG